MPFAFLLFHIFGAALLHIFLINFFTVATLEVYLKLIEFAYSISENLLVLAKTLYRVTM